MSDSSHPLLDPANLTDQEQARRQNLQTLIDAGIDPYPARVQRTHTIAEARALHESGQTGPVSIVGRIKAIRVMGKISFADLEDGSGHLQVVMRRDDLPEGWYNDIWRKAIDLGDFIGASGPLFVTKSGELSVEARAVHFLSKTLKPMPDKWHGVRDPEVRYRRRYVPLHHGRTTD